MEQDRKPRNKPNHMKAPLIKEVVTYNGEETASSMSGARKTDSYM